MEKENDENKIDKETKENEENEEEEQIANLSEEESERAIDELYTRMMEGIREIKESKNKVTLESIFKSAEKSIEDETSTIERHFNVLKDVSEKREEQLKRIATQYKRLSEGIKELSNIIREYANNPDKDYLREVIDKGLEEIEIENKLMEDHISGLVEKVKERERINQEIYSLYEGLSKQLEDLGKLIADYFRNDPIDTTQALVSTSEKDIENETQYLNKHASTISQEINERQELVKKTKEQYDALRNGIQEAIETTLKYFKTEEE